MQSSHGSVGSSFNSSTFSPNPALHVLGEEDTYEFSEDKLVEDGGNTGETSNFDLKSSFCSSDAIDAGYSDLEKIVAIDSVEDVSDGRRSSMLVRVRGSFNENREGRLSAFKGRRGQVHRRPLGKLFEGGEMSDEEDHRRPTEVGPAYDEGETEKVEMQVDDKQLMHFCGVVLQLLRKELDSSPGQSTTYKRETLPKLREAFKKLVNCTEVPQWLTQKANDLRIDMENKSGDGMAAIHEHDDSEEEWKRKLSMTRKEVARVKDQEAAVERQGMVNFVKHCVSAIGILKSKIEKDKLAIQQAQQENMQASIRAKEEARREAEAEWSRRISMVRRETERKTKEQLADKFKQAEGQMIKELEEKIRSETESEWTLRLKAEQKNRRLSAQVKMTLAVERVTQRAEMEKQHALSALAEELEKEKELATKQAADVARKTAEHEWKEKLSMGIKEAKADILTQLRQEQVHQKENNDGNNQHHHHEEMWVEKSREVRRFSLVEGNVNDLHAQRERVRIMMRNSTGGISRGTENSPASSRFSSDYGMPSPIPLAPIPIDDSIASSIVSRNTPGPEHPEKRCSFRQEETPKREKEKPYASASSSKSRRTKNNSSKSKKKGLPFQILELKVLPGELKGSSLVGKFREYSIITTISVSKKELRTKKTVRYSSAREQFHDQLYREAERLGYQHSFQPVFATFPPKAIGSSNSDDMGKTRAKSIQTYLLSVYDVGERLYRISKSEQDQSEVEHLMDVVFSDFLQ